MALRQDQLRRSDRHLHADSLRWRRHHHQPCRQCRQQHLPPSDTNANYKQQRSHHHATYNTASSRFFVYKENITKTRLYNVDLLKPHFYIVKLGFTGVCIIFLISAQKIDCGHSLEPPRRGGSNEYHNLCFEQKYEKYRRFLSEDFQFFGSKNFNVFE